MESALAPIFPISALQKKQGAVKEAAQNSIVRITENGVGAYVFCTEEMFNTALSDAAEAAAYEARMEAAIVRGRADISAGRTYSGIDAVLEAIEERING